MMTQILNTIVLKWQDMQDRWWQWLLFSIVVLSTAFGITYVCISLIRRTIKYSKDRPVKDVVSMRALNSLNAVSVQLLPRAKAVLPKPTTFGVYLGDFTAPPTAAQHEVLVRSDLVILDPFRNGVAAAIRRLQGHHYLARLDLVSLLAGEGSADEAAQRIGAVLLTTLNRSTFTGVLLAGWESILTPAYLSAVTKFIDAVGFVVYLETAPPDFLPNTDILSNSVIAGLVIRNAAILPNGLHRDYFDMAPLQPTVRAFVKESCLREFSVLAWEGINDGSTASIAVIKRATQWCGFYSAVTWVGSTAALTDAEWNLSPIEPLGAFEWLKDEGVMKTHATWKNNQTICECLNTGCEEAWADIAQSVRSTNTFLSSSRRVSKAVSENTFTLRHASRISSPTLAHRSMQSISTLTSNYDGLGCFPLGVEVTPLAFAEVLQGQVRLRNLGLLNPVDTQKITNMGILFRKFHDRHLQKIYEDTPDVTDAVKEASLLAINGHLRINVGLSPGFQHGSDIRFWAVEHHDKDGTEVFVSRDAQGLTGTVLHAVLSANGLSRDLCFEVEAVFAEWNGELDKGAGLTKRMVQDVDLLTPEERLLLLQQLSLSQYQSPVMENVMREVRRKLLDAPSKLQLNELDSVDYLNSRVTPTELLEARFAWYDQNEVQHPELICALAFFKDLERRLVSMLRNRQEDELKTFNLAMDTILSQHEIDAWADLLGLATFCAARKAAVDEVYLEVTDRNPLLNDQPDQAAVFSESFALGSRCEAYFDVSPSVFGKILSDRYRAHYNEKQPPLWNNGAPDFATAYAGAGIDVDSEHRVAALPEFQRFTFLSVFAIPALVDIALLTTVGRGLYLSAFMTLDEQRSATLALMIALLLSGATGTWIACGGSYYLISMAFSAMNVFVLTRLFAGIALTIAGALVGFVVMSGAKGFHSGFVFFLYLVAFTTYLTLFAAIASFQFPGSSFISGRKLIIFCLPWLLVSPVITMWTHHDVYVYLVVFYLVLAILFICLRRVGAQWVTWYQGLRQTNDSEIRTWYTENKASGDAKVLSAMTDPAALKVAREALLEDIQAELDKRFFTRPTQDELVLRLATDYEATNFLLDWYCRYSDVPRPIPYSSSWNIQTKVALQTLCDNQKGIRLHNGFIHWRQAGDEVGCGILYFLVALLDKWVELLTGEHLIGLTSSLNDQFRMAVGLGLAYYLIGAVLIDVKAQELHGAVNISNPEGIRTPKELRAHQKNEIRVRRAMYRRTLFRFLTLHCWSLAITTSIVWVLQGSAEGMMMFLAYVFAYTGLLWYQYTKIFSGPFALKPLLVAVCLGIPVGVGLKKTMPDFKYGGVSCLAIATWTAALLCLQSAKLGMPKKVRSAIVSEEVYHGYTKPWADPEWSQIELKTIYENLSVIESDGRFTVSPTQHPGTEVKAILENRYGSRALEDAFPDYVELVELAIQAWESGQIELELVSLAKLGSDLRALSCRTSRKIKLVIGVGKGAELQANMRNNCQIIAELLLHEVAEAYFRLPHDHACLAEHLVSDGIPMNMRLMLAEETERHLVANWSRKEILRQQCLGLQCDIYWDDLSQKTREYFLKRSLGEVCMISDAEQYRLTKLLCRNANDELSVHIARCDLAIEVASKVIDFANQRLWSHPLRRPEAEDLQEVPSLSILSYLGRPISYVYHSLGLTVKYIVVALVADPEWQREFNHQMKDKHAVIRIPASFALNGLWTYSRWIQTAGLSVFLLHQRPRMQELWEQTKGLTVTQTRNKVVIHGLEGTFTAFRRPDQDGGFKLYHFKGIHKCEPEGNTILLHSITTHSITNELLIKEEYLNGQSTNLYEYDYDVSSERRSVFGPRQAKIPHTRRCVRGPKYLESISYNAQGFVEGGSYMTDGNLVHFKLQYRKNARYLDEVLRAEFVMAHLSANVSWCAPPRRNAHKLDKWIPLSKVTHAKFLQSTDEYECKWTYDHKFHPTITTTLNEEIVQTPPMIEHDWLGILKKPKPQKFTDENPLFHSNFWNSNRLSKFLGLSRHRVPISTSVARSRIWKAWKNGKDLDGVIVRWMDEKLIRKDPTLAPYWRLRNRGNLTGAKKYISDRADAVMASADLDEEISSWTPLAIKLGDLYSFGPGGDTVLHTRAKDVGKDTNETLHVLAADNGTWPNEGGGVSACRRDMINSLETIKWHMLCESATDFGVPKHQTEQNVLSLKVIPLWGLDFLTPTHGLFKNKLDSEVHMLQSSATDYEIKKNFIPILTALVKGARTAELASADLKQATRAFVDLHDYFQDKRHWSEVWKADVTKDVWRALWLSDDMPNTKSTSDWFDTELPTLGHFDTALELWLRYLFVFSIQVPEKIPAIFQASHHSVSAAYGVVCKVKRNCQLQIWDHAIAWRETNMCLSSTLCKLPPFVRNSLLGLMKMTSVLILHHADVILPCADFFNPGWEVEIGTCQGTIEHRNRFKRKISPVVNGIPDAEKFQPIKEITTKTPTVTMLSHLWFCKDLKTAILAADIISNEWGFKDYQLHVYGSIEKAPIYSNECQELIASKSLRGQVKLCGSADPLKVLEQTWLFMNSSLSEGLPLALGEAALTGAPVVCTDVGASLRVLSDPDDFSRYSAVVAPNDARALARAQIKLLGMLDEFGEHAEDDGPSPVMPFSPTAKDVEWITARMYEKSEQRRKLGMMTRHIVQKSFSGERYLREHEQMLWIGKLRKIMETRHPDEASSDPAEIARILQLNTGVNEEVIPRSAAPSLYAQSTRSTSLYDRNTPPPILEDMEELIDKDAARSYMDARPVSRFSTTTADTDWSTLKPTAGITMPQRVTALPNIKVEDRCGGVRRTSWYNFPKIAVTLAGRNSMYGHKQSRNQRKYAVIDTPPGSRGGAAGDFRTSDIALTNVTVDANGNATNIMTMEAPAKHRKEASYRNLAPSDPNSLSVEKSMGRPISPGFDRGLSPGGFGESLIPGLERMHSARGGGRPTTPLMFEKFKFNSPFASEGIEELPKSDPGFPEP